MGLKPLIFSTNYQSAEADINGFFNNDPWATLTGFRTLSGLIFRLSMIYNLIIRSIRVIRVPFFLLFNIARFGEQTIFNRIIRVKRIQAENLSLNRGMINFQFILKVMKVNLLSEMSDVPGDL